MRKVNFRKSIIALTVVYCLGMSSSAVIAKNNDNIDMFKNATSVAEPNSLPSLTPKSGGGSNGEVSALASSSKTTKTGTGGILTSNTWLGAVDSDQLADYQVSANYNKTDHQYIKTTWYATIGAVSTSSTASVSMSFPLSGTVSASTTTTVTNASTPSKYYENSKSQQDASYRSNVAIQGAWKYVTMTNEASCWGNKVVKKASINSQATQNK